MEYKLCFFFVETCQNKSNIQRRVQGAWSDRDDRFLFAYIRRFTQRETCRNKSIPEVLTYFQFQKLFKNWLNKSIKSLIFSFKSNNEI